MKDKKRHIEHINEIEKSKAFKAPEGYFDQFQKDVFSRIDGDKQVKSSGKIVQFRTLYAVAASIAILLVSSLIVWYFTNQNNLMESGYDEILSEVSDEEIIAYLEYSDVSYAEISPYLSKDFSIKEAEDQTESFQFEDDEAEALLEYYSL
ncbi:hypothetical protein [Marivirga sp.]|uniref:hypothetical protein n=1 Tax=Marivirga sp. TaxID=2018662 RepID=UPI003DA7A434